jgi:hypothetical protein
MMHLRLELALGSVVAILAFSAFSQENDKARRAPSNLELMRSLAATIGDSVGAAIGRQDSSSLGLTVLPKDMAWYVESALLQGLSKHRLVIRAAGENELAGEFGLGKARVEYEDIRRQSFLGSKIVDRKVTVIIIAKVVDQKKGSILLARDFQEAYRDTIPLSEIQNVESLGLPLTRGTVPKEGFFSNLAEPLVMLGAIGVAVYLLFNVRS